MGRDRARDQHILASFGASWVMLGVPEIAALAATLPLRIFTL